MKLLSQFYSVRATRFGNSGLLLIPEHLECLALTRVCCLSGQTAWEKVALLWCSNIHLSMGINDKDFQTANVIRIQITYRRIHSHLLLLIAVNAAIVIAKSLDFFFFLMDCTLRVKHLETRKELELGDVFL